ncbi:flagellar hook assembly protein FlgD [Desulfocurvus sp. DL9XJH121]
MYTSATDLITASYGSSSSSDTASSELGKDAFLHLLIAQLEWQDPLDPMDDTEMVAQLAQFTTLETMQGISSKMDETLEIMDQELFAHATGYIGKDVEAAGSTIVKDGDSISTVTFTLTSDSASTYAHILTTGGDVITTVPLGGLAAGEYSYVWDGLDLDGNEVDDGSYYIAFKVFDENGDSSVVSTQVSGTVQSVFAEDGEVYLELSDGRTIAASGLSKVVNSKAGSSEE